MPALNVLLYSVPFLTSTILELETLQLPVSVPAVPLAPVVNVLDFKVPPVKSKVPVIVVVVLPPDVPVLDAKLYAPGV